MAVLPTKDAIVRFDENEDRFNTFVNNTGTYTTNSGLPAVETLPSFMARNNEALNLLTATNVKGDWTTTTTYSVWDEVKYSGTWYRCVVAHTSTGSFDSSKWRVSQGVTSSELALSSGSGLIGFLQSGMGAVSTTVQDRLREFVSLKDFGGVPDGVTNNDTAITNWLTYLAANPFKIGIADGGIYAMTFIEVSAPSGISIEGNATFKALGANRTNMFRLINLTGLTNINGVTFDGNNIVARPFELENIGNIVEGDVYIGSRVRFINSKNVAPRTDVASGFRVQGKFNRVVFAGEVDGVDNNLTTGAVCVGAWFDWSSTFFIKNVVVTSTASIKNVRNDNTITADADGIQCMAPTTERASFTVESGAYFENCKGRTIKSQATDNAINSPVIMRTLYDGIAEIDCQYGGGYCVGARVYHNNVRVHNVIVSTTRLNLPSDFTMRDNILTIGTAPATPTGSMCLFWGQDATNAIKQEGLLCAGNKVIGGSVNHLVTVYAANVVDTNRIVIKDNYAHSIAVAYINMEVVNSNHAQLTVVFENNACRTACTGALVVSGGQLYAESDRNNSKISPLPQAIVTIAVGVITLYAGNYQLVANEGGAGYDDVVTINGGTYSTGETVLFKAAYASELPKFKNGIGNIFLSGSDFELNSTKDTLVLSYDSVLNQWCEVSRSNNG